MGVRQSGIAAFRFARMPEDVELLERARAAARDIVDEDPELSAPELAPLADALLERHGEIERLAIPA
jgi:ATP-dependent DNA helicase RecG